MYLSVVSKDVEFKTAFLSKNLEPSQLSIIFPSQIVSILFMRKKKIINSHPLPPTKISQ